MGAYVITGIITPLLPSEKKKMREITDRKCFKKILTNLRPQDSWNGLGL